MKKVILLYGMILLNLSLYAQGKLETVKKDLSEIVESNPVSKEHTKDNVSSKNKDGGILIDIIYELVSFVTFKTFIGAEYAEAHLNNKLTPYPYYNNETQGNYTSGAIYNNQRLDIHNSILFGKPQIYGNDFSIKYRPTRQIYFEGNYKHLFEFRNENQIDVLILYFLNFGYDRIKLEKFNLGWKLGMNYISSNVNKTGFNAGLSIEFFLEKHVSLLGTVNFGLVNGIGLNNHNFDLKYHTNNFFVSPGYEKLTFGPTTFNFAKVGFGMYF